MQHAGQAHVLHIGHAAAHLGRNVDPRQILADQAPALLAPGNVGLGRDVEREARHQLAIAQGLPVRPGGDAVVQLDLVGGSDEAPGGGLGQQDTDVGRGVEQRGPAVLHRMAAGRDTLVGRACRVGGDEFDVVGKDRKLIGGDLDQGGLQPLAEFGLAGEDGDATVGADLDPRIELRIFVEIAGQAVLLGRPLRGALSGHGEGHDQRALAEQRASAEHRHVLSSRTPPPMAAAARRTAARMRMWVPQRQRLGAMCWRSSVSVGVVVRSSSACARMIMPAMQ